MDWNHSQPLAAQTLEAQRGVWAFPEPVTSMLTFHDTVWCGSWKQIALIDPEAGQVVLSKECCESWILCLTQVDNVVWSGGADGVIRLWKDLVCGSH